MYVPQGVNCINKYDPNKISGLYIHPSFDRIGLSNVIISHYKNGSWPDPGCCNYQFGT